MEVTIIIFYWESYDGVVHVPRWMTIVREKVGPGDKNDGYWWFLPDVRVYRIG